MKKLLFCLVVLPIFFTACDRKEPIDPVAVYDPTPYTLNLGSFPAPALPTDNALTIAGVQLGRMLFYEKLLSRNNSQACVDCHKQQDGFADIRTLSIGVAGLPGHRQAMAVMNLAWAKNGLFWDGRAPKVRDQVLKPIQDALEMNETLPNAVAKLSADKRYTDQFTRAFGDTGITSERMSLALEQFVFTLISNQSKYDHYKHQEAVLTDTEERGRKLFFTEHDPFGTTHGAECFHCHSGFNFTNEQYMNNALDADAEQMDVGREKVTNDPADRAKFRVPSLRNIAVTAPYMHDGRFATLEEVVEHYNSGAKASATADELLQYSLQPGGLQLTQQDKADLVAFLKTLTDPDFLTNLAFTKPE